MRDMDQSSPSTLPRCHPIEISPAVSEKPRPTRAPRAIPARRAKALAKPPHLALRTKGTE